MMGDVREETLEGKADDAEVPFRCDRMGTSGNAIHERNLLGVRLDRLGLHLSQSILHQIPQICERFDAAHFGP